MSTEKIRMELGARLKSLRNEWSISQKEMAQRIDIGVSTYQYYERGERDIPAKALILITTFGVYSDWLLTGQGDMLLNEGNSSSEPINLNDAVLAEDSKIIKRYGDMEAGRDMNNDIIDIENMSPVTFQELRGYIKGLANGLRTLFSTKQNGRTEEEQKKEKA